MPKLAPSYCRPSRESVRLPAFDKWLVGRSWNYAALVYGLSYFVLDGGLYGLDFCFRSYSIYFVMSEFTELSSPQLFTPPLDFCRDYTSLSS